MTRDSTPSVDRLIASLDAGGLSREAGAFTLDREKARDKMRQFQFAVPQRYVLELVQAAVRKGATRIRFDIDADDMRMTFDGPPFSLEDFEALYNVMFTRSERPGVEAVRQLSLGLNAAMALNPRWIRVWSGQGGSGAHLEMRPGRDDHYERAEVSREGTFIHVKGRFRPGLAVTFFQNLKGTLPEELLLREDCRYSRVVVDLEGTILSSGLGLPDHVGVVPFQSDELAGVVGINPNQEHEPRLHLVRDGVWITTHSLKGAPMGFVAVVDSPAFRKDVSQTDIVRDEAYKRAEARLRFALGASVSLVARELREAWDQRASPGFSSAWGLRLCREVMGTRPPESLRDPVEGTLSHYLGRVPMWRTLTDDLVDTASLFGEVAAKGRVGYTTRAFGSLGEDPELSHLELSPEALCQGDLILWLNRDDHQELRRVLGPHLTLVTKALNARVEAVKNKRLWKSRPARGRLSSVTDAAPFLLTQTFEDSGVTGEIGVMGDLETTSTVFMVVEGHTLCRFEVHLPVPSLKMVLEAPFSPNVRFDHVKRDATYSLAVTAAMSATGLLFERLAAWMPSGERAQRVQRTLVASWVTALGQPDFGDRFFAAFGLKSRAQKVVLPTTVSALRVAVLGAPASGVAPTCAVARLPIFPTLDEGWCSLVDLWDRQQEGEPLSYVDPSLQRIPGRGQQALRLTDEERVSLGTWFGVDALSDVTEDHRAWLAEARFLTRPEEPVRLGGRDLAEGPWRIRFQGDGLSGEVALAWGVDRGQAAFWAVRLLHRGRMLAKRDLPLGFLSGAAVVSDDTVTPEKEWEDVVEDAAFRRVPTVIHQAAFVLVGYLARHFQHVNPTLRPAVKALLIGALDATLPTRNFGLALGAFLRQGSEDPEGATRAYGELLGLLATEELLSVDLAIGELLDAGGLPTARAVLNYGPKMEGPPPLPRLALEVLGSGEGFGGETGEGFGGTTPPLEEGHCPFGALFHSTIFVDDDGQPCSLADAFSDLETTGEVLILDEATSPEDVPERRIFLVPGGQDRILRHAFGHGALVSGLPYVEASRQRKRFAGRREVERPSLPADEVLVSMSLESPSRQGEVGLSSRPQGGSWLHLYHRRRRLCTVERFSRFGLLVAVGDDDLTPTEDFSGVERDEAYARLVATCEASVPELLQRLADRLGVHPEQKDLGPQTEKPPSGQWSLSDDEREAALGHLLLWLSRPKSKGLAEQARAQDQDPVLARWLHVPLVSGLMGRLYSLSDLLGAEEEHGELVYLPSMPEDAPHEASRCLLVGTGLLIKRLRQIFPRVRNYKKQWELDQVVHSLRKRGTPPLADSHKTLALVRVAAALGSIKGSLHLPESRDEPLVILFGVQGFEVQRINSGGLYPCAGHFVVPDELAEQFLKGALGVEEGALLKEARNLYRSLATRFSSIRKSESTTRWARDLLRGLLDRLLVAETERAPLEPADQRLFNQLRHLPLLPLGNDFINLEVARQRRPPELAHMGYFQEPTSAQGARANSPVPEAQLDSSRQSFSSPSSDQPSAPASGFEPAPASGSEPASSSGSETASSSGSETAPPFGFEPAPPFGFEPAPASGSEPAPASDQLSEPASGFEPAPTLSPEEALVRDLRGELERIVSGRSMLLEHIRMVPMFFEARQGKAAVSYVDGAILLHRRHPLVARALSDSEQDPILVTFLASALYTAVNLALLEVTDEDEAAFHGHLLQAANRARSKELPPGERPPGERPPGDLPPGDLPPGELP